MLVSDLVRQVVNDMQASPFGYQFAVDTRGSFMPHETLPLQLLELVNRGTRPNGGSIRLRRAPPRANQTIQDLATDRMRFASVNINMEGNHLALNFGKQWIASLSIHCALIKKISVVRNYPLTAITSLSGDSGPRAHTCISRKLYRQFHHDGPNGLAENSDNDNLTSSDDEVEPLRVSSSSIRSIQPRRSSRLTSTSRLQTDR